MASGSWTFDISSSQYGQVDWSGSAGTGGSNVSATVYVYARYRQNYTINNGYWLNINGSQVSGSSARVNTSGGTWHTIISHSVWVGYTGNKSVSISCNLNMSNITNSGSVIGNKGGSWTATLDRVGSIPPNVTVTAPSAYTDTETQSQVVIRWNRVNDYSGACKYRIQYSVNGGTWTHLVDNIPNGTTSYTDTFGAGQGRRIQYRVDAYNDVGYSAGWGYSGVVTKNQLWTPSIGIIDRYNPYNGNLTVFINGGGQSNGKALRKRADLYWGDTWLQTGTGDTNGNTNVLFTYSAANYAAKIGTKAYSSGNFKIVAWCENDNGTRSGYTTSWFTVDLNTDGQATPTLGAPTFSGGILGNATTCFVKGVNSITVKSATATLRRAPSGTTVSYRISISGETTKSGQQNTFSFNGATGIKTVTVTATDSRGLSATVTKQFYLQSWAKPTIKINTYERLTNPNTSGKVDYSISYSPIYQYTSPNTKGNQLNGITSQQYNKNNGAWTNCTSPFTITDLNTELIYNINLRVNDKVKTGEYGTDSCTIPTIKSIVSMRRTGVGIMCVPQNGVALDVGGTARFNGDVQYLVGGRARTPIKMIAGDTAGDGIKMEAGGCIVIGSGESATNFLKAEPNLGNVENTYVVSDRNAFVITNMQNGYDKRKTFHFTGYGNFILSGNIHTPKATNTYLSGNTDGAIINSTAKNGAYVMLYKGNTHNGKMTMGTYQNNFDLYYTANSTVNAGTNAVTHRVTLLNEDGATVVKDLYSDNSVRAQNGFLFSTAWGKEIRIGSQTERYCHYSTTAPNHWFNKNVMVQGDIYGGSGYNKRVAYLEELNARVRHNKSIWMQVDGMNDSAIREYSVVIPDMGGRDYIEVNINAFDRNSSRTPFVFGHCGDINTGNMGWTYTRINGNNSTARIVTREYIHGARRFNILFVG